MDLQFLRWREEDASLEIHLAEHDAEGRGKGPAGLHVKVSGGPLSPALDSPPPAKRPHLAPECAFSTFAPPWVGTGSTRPLEGALGATLDGTNPRWEGRAWADTGK